MLLGLVRILGLSDLSYASSVTGPFYEAVYGLPRSSSREHNIEEEADPTVEVSLFTTERSCLTLLSRERSRCENSPPIYDKYRDKEGPKTRNIV